MICALPKLPQILLLPLKSSVESSFYRFVSKILLKNCSLATGIALTVHIQLEGPGSLHPSAAALSQWLMKASFLCLQLEQTVMCNLYTGAFGFSGLRLRLMARMRLGLHMNHTFTGRFHLLCPAFLIPLLFTPGKNFLNKFPAHVFSSQCLLLENLI